MSDIQHTINRLFLLFTFIVLPTIYYGQTVSQPSGSGVDGSYTVNCGSTITYTDNGGPGDYSANQNSFITICPSIAGQYVSINFNVFDLETNDDYLYIFDGNDGSANLIGVYTGVTSPGIVTASSDNPSGCLSFRFSSDAATNNTGWDASITCTSTAAAPYPAHGIEDCNGAVTICSNSALVGGTTGSGMHELHDNWNHCIATGENQSNWYVFSPQTSGTIGFQITPNSPTDYDWAIWGPYTSLECPAYTGDPTFRCSSSQLIGNGNTGLVAPAVDTIEQNGEYVACCGSTGDGFLAPISATAGEVYIMMIDNWSASNVGFQLNWNLTNGATLDCTPPLPISLTSFNAECENNLTLLKWTTESELNNNFFIIEKANDDFVFKEIGKVMGAGNSSHPINYEFLDNTTSTNTTYYRLVQVDYDGSVEYHRIVASNCFNNNFQVVKSILENNNLDLLVTSSSNEKIEINLYNSSGKHIISKTEILYPGNNTFNYKGINTSSGIYFISIRGKLNNYSSKLLNR